MGWERVASLEDFGARDVMSVVGRDQRIALYRLPDGIFATADACPHLSASLSGGEVVEGYVECPAHHALFDIRTGRCDGGVTNKDVLTYPTKAENGDIYVRLE